MDKDKYNRNVELMCPTCGGSQFEHDEDDPSDDATVHCVGCDRTVTKQELIDENTENINQNVREIGNDVMKDLQKELERSFKKGFK